MDKLQKQILNDASRRAEEAESLARKQAAEILQKAKERAREIEDAKKKELADEISRMEAEQVANSELEENSVMLDARNAVIEGALPGVRSLVVKMMKEKGYEKLVSMAIREAEEIAPQNELVLVVNKGDSAHVKNFKGKVTYGEVVNGIEIQTKDGSVKITATIDGLFERNRQEIEKALIEEAFPTRQRKTSPSSEPKAKARAAARPKKRPAKKQKTKKSGKRRSR